MFLDKNGRFRDRSLFSGGWGGGGGPLYLGGGSLFFLSHIGEGHFFIKAIKGRATIFWSWVFSRVLYNEKSGYWPSLPLVSYPFIIAVKGTCFGYTLQTMIMTIVTVETWK